MRVDVDVGLQGWELRRTSADREHTCGGRGYTSKSQAQLRLNTSPCTKMRGYRGLRYRLQQWVEVNGPFIPVRNDVLCCGDMD